MRFRVTVFAAGKKKPHGVSGGVGFLFFSKEVTEFNNRFRDTFLLLLDSDLLVFVVIFLLASKSFLTVFAIECSYTSLGQSIKSKSCANVAIGPVLTSI